MHAASTEQDIVANTRRFLDEILANGATENLSVRLWDGTMWPDNGERAAVLVLKHEYALEKMFAPGTEVGLAEAYLYDDFDIEGDIAVAFEIADYLLAGLGRWTQKLKQAGLLLSLPDRDERSKVQRVAAYILPRTRGTLHSVARDRRAISYHYDVSNEFYELWLDRSMTYSCAYFRSDTDSLNKAQEQKLDYICRKLRLQPGQRLLDIGCGWGGLLIHAAKNFGVHATGITLSNAQLIWANRRIAETGSTAQARIELCDYRELPTNHHPYDAIVSVGMAEHVGRENLPILFGKAFQLLKSQGVFLNQAIGENIVARPDNSGGSFIAQYVFPDGDIPPLPIVLRAAESAGFEIRDVENLREHYALTLEHWLRRLERNHQEALAFVDETTYRIWRLYLAGSGHAFRHAHLAVYQTLLIKPDGSGRTDQPLTRHRWYFD